MEKTDLTKTYKSYYTAKAKPELTRIEKAQFITITGKGDPSSAFFAEKVQALYSAAYGVKFRYKENGRDFTVAKLEGQWWFDEKKFRVISPAEAPLKVPRSEWEYRLLIRLPDYVEEKEVKTAISGMAARKEIQYLNEVKFHVMEEGAAVQMLHVGPFDTEPITLQQMQEFMNAQGLVKNGTHHEIYLSDFRKTSPENLKTILREPCKYK